MKIRQRINCVTCGEDFILRFGKLGRINECEECATDIPLVRASQSDEDGFFQIEGLCQSQNAIRNTSNLSVSCRA